MLFIWIIIQKLNYQYLEILQYADKFNILFYECYKRKIIDLGTK